MKSELNAIMWAISGGLMVHGCIVASSISGVRDAVNRAARVSTVADLKSVPSTIGTNAIDRLEDVILGQGGAVWKRDSPGEFFYSFTTMNNRWIVMSNGVPIFTITADGNVIYDTNNVSEATRLFWDELSRHVQKLNAIAP